MLTGPTPKFHGTWDILAQIAASNMHGLPDLEVPTWRNGGSSRRMRRSDEGWAHINVA